MKPRKQYKKRMAKHVKKAQRAKMPLKTWLELLQGMKDVKWYSRLRRKTGAEEVLGEPKKCSLWTSYPVLIKLPNGKLIDTKFRRIDIEEEDSDE